MPPPRPDRLISFVCENDADLLPQFIRWYRGLGVEHFHLILHGRWSTAGLALVEGLEGVDSSRRVDQPFCKTLKCDEITACARRFPGQWLVFADADEFFQPPTASLADAAAMLEEAGVDEMHATMLQRVAADGGLPEVKADSRLDELFPLVSFGLCEEMGLERPAWKSKYPLARIGPRFAYQRGNHLPGNHRSVAHVPIRGVVHHFKWRSRLLDAFAQERGEGTNFAEMAVYRRYVGTHGRLPTELAKSCTTETLFADGWLRLPNEREWPVLRRMIGERQAATAAGIRFGFVTFELGGPSKTNGGIATAMSALAKLQAAHGHQVDVFYCPFHGPAELPPLWFEYWATFGVRLHYLPRYDVAGNRELESNELCAAILRAVREQGHFDVLHFHDTQGYAAPFTMLKKAGLAFEQTKLVITTHGGTRWHNEPNGTPWREAEYGHELIGQRLCDLVVSPSAYMIGWNERLDAAGSRRLVIPNVLEPESKAATGRPPERVVPRCLAFFGRVERRKGIDLFIAALRELTARTRLRPEVFILGRFGTGYSQERLDGELRGIDCPVHLFQSLNPQQALRLMREKGALAIMPSRQENSPYVAFEAMENQLPFLVSFTGGTAELIHPDDLSQAELPAEPPEMAEAIRRALVEGLRPARPRFDPLEIELEHLVLWRTLAGEPNPAVPRPPAVHRCRPDRWEAASRRAAGDVVALLPDGVEVSQADLDALGRLLASSPLVDLVQSACRLEDEERDFSMSSLRLERLDAATR
ncbi:MAG: glycosyltransferase, partial [Planctomycetia bacterium]|nr:glycosyltransferase [Planctomycetia bacterium]